MTPAELQRTQALSKANEVRLRKAGLKRELRALPAGDSWGRAADLIERECLEPSSFKIGELLLAVTRLGFERARLVLRYAGIVSMDRRLADLTVRQRELVVVVLRDPRILSPASRIRVP